MQPCFLSCEYLGLTDIDIASIFTFFALFIETYTLWLERRDRKTSLPVHEKHHSQASSAPLHQNTGQGPESHNYPTQGDQAYPTPANQANPTLGNQTYPAPGQQIYPPLGQQTYNAQGGQGYPVQGSQAAEVHTVGTPQAAWSLYHIIILQNVGLGCHEVRRYPI